MMAESGGGSPPGNSSPQNSTRILAVAAAAAAVLAVVVAIGLAFTGGDESADDPVPSSTLVATVTAARTTAAVQPTVRPSFSAPNTSALPTQPAHRVGDDCSSGGITGRWDVVTGTGWVCVPTMPGIAPSAPDTQGGR